VQKNHNSCGKKNHKMNKIVVLILVAMCLSGRLLGQVSNIADKIYYPKHIPLIKQTKDWKVGEYWKSGKVGKRDFYITEQGNYVRTSLQS
jgi:hypothetical protein